MATYITTLKFTDQGARAIGETTKRASAFESQAAEVGVEVRHIYWTMGVNDGVIIFDAADDETATAAMLSLESRGNVHTTTSRAFNAAEMDNVLAKVKN